MSIGERSTADRHAKRVNAAVRMLASGLSVAEAARKLARRHGVSERQARRYAEQARDSGLIEVPKPKTVFTVKLPVDLIKRMKRHAASTQTTLSSLVAQGLEEFLARISDRLGESPLVQAYRILVPERRKRTEGVHDDNDGSDLCESLHDLTKAGGNDCQSDVRVEGICQSPRAGRAGRRGI